MNALLLTASLLLAADPPADGFYRQSTGDDAPVVQSADGRSFKLGERRELEIRESELISESNENDLFSLSLQVPYDEEIGPGTSVLVVDGRAFPLGGSGADHEKISFLFFSMRSEEDAERVAAFVGTPVLRRRHPGHRLLTTFTPDKTTYTVGEPVTVTLRIKNVGDTPFAFQKGGRNRAVRDNQYTFAAYLYGAPVVDVGTTHHFGGMSVSTTIPPGETFEDTVDLNKWFAFDKPGHYAIHGAYYLSFHEPDAASYRPIWEDHASADFAVRVEAAEGEQAQSLVPLAPPVQSSQK